MNVNKLFASAIVAAGVAMPALAQQWQYEYRIIADGDAGAPTGAWAQQPFSLSATQIGFWIQARVMMTGATGNQANWGIGRCTAPGVPNNDFVVISDSVASSLLNRGRINSSGTALFGRGSGYRNGGASPTANQNTAAGNNGNNVGAGTVPGLMPTAFAVGTTNDENGAFDSGNDRIYGWDAYVGGTRNSPVFNDPDNGPTDVVDNNTGLPVNPWNVNGAAGPSNANPTANAATPVAQGTFSPWANLYRFVVIVTDTTTPRTVTLNSAAQLNGTVQAAPSSAGGNSWAMQLSSPFQASATYSWTYPPIPTPGVATLLGLGGLAMARRRR